MVWTKQLTHEMQILKGNETLKTIGQKALCTDLLEVEVSSFSNHMHRDSEVTIKA